MVLPEAYHRAHQLSYGAGMYGHGIHGYGMHGYGSYGGYGHPGQFAAGYVNPNLNRTVDSKLVDVSFGTGKSIQN